MRIQRTLGRFPSPTPCWRANERNIVGPRFHDRERIEMKALVGSEVWPVSNFIQQLPTSRNNTQQHTTWCANARNMLGPTMLRAFARAFSCGSVAANPNRFRMWSLTKFRSRKQPVKTTFSWTKIKQEHKIILLCIRGYFPTFIVFLFCFCFF